MSGFTKLGHPIQGRRYTITQGEVSIPVTVVGKLYGRGGNSDLIGVIFEDENGRATLPWPIEATPGAPSISITSGWTV
jgi:hypothetical protein